MHFFSIVWNPFKWNSVCDKCVKHFFSFWYILSFQNLYFSEISASDFDECTILKEGETN